MPMRWSPSTLSYQVYYVVYNCYILYVVVSLCCYVLYLLLSSIDRTLLWKPLSCAFLRFTAQKPGICCMTTQRSNDGYITLQAHPCGGVCGRRCCMDS